MADVKSFREELIEKVFLKMVRVQNAASNVIKFYPNGQSGKHITLIVLLNETSDLDNWRVIEVPDKDEIDPSAYHIDLKIYNALSYFDWNWIKGISKILLYYPDVNFDRWNDFVDIDDSNCDSYQLTYNFEMDISKLSSTLIANKLNSEEIRKEIRAIMQSHIDQIIGENKDDKI